MGNNQYDDGFMARFAYHYARIGSVPLCVKPLLEDFPMMDRFNKGDLNQLRSRHRKKTGEDLLEAERSKYMEEMSEVNNLTAIDNIRNGKESIDSSIEILIEKLNDCNTMILEHEVGTKMFMILMNTQKSLMELISKFTGIEDAMAVKRAYAFSLLKQGKVDDANAAITGVKKVEESQVPQLMDGDYDDEEQDEENQILDI